MAGRDIRDPKFARECLEDWIPERGIRRSVLFSLAQSILEAHRNAPGCWGISLLPNNKKLARLNAGMVNVFVVTDSDSHFLLVDEKVPAELKGRTFTENYANAPGTRGISISGAEMEQLYGIARDAHFRAIRNAARRRSGYLWPESHSSGLLQYLREWLGMELPDPSYTPAPARATWLLTWNPKRWPWSQLVEEAGRSRHGDRVVERWSCGNTKAIQPADRVFLLRQGVEPRGIMASGWATGFAVEDEHWDENRPDDVALYIPCELDRVLDPAVEAPLSIDRLNETPLSNVNWATQVSGIRIEAEAAAAVEVLWAEHIGRPTPRQGPPVTIDDELAAFEGEQRFHFVRHRTREAGLRDAKLEEALRNNAGRLRCEVPGCGFDFFERYGSTAKGYAQVHHLQPLSTREAASKTCLSDLAVVCANCHVIIHRGGQCRPLEGLITSR